MMKMGSLFLSGRMNQQSYKKEIDFEYRGRLIFIDVNLLGLHASVGDVCCLVFVPLAVEEFLLCVIEIGIDSICLRACCLC